MLISPPFLPQGSFTEEGFLNAAMPPPISAVSGTGGAPEGSFPVSGGFEWHNGLHLDSPILPHGYGCLPVCAIADGVVIYAKPPPQECTDLNHGQTYGAFSNEKGAVTWTDIGMLVLAHTTEIGASGHVPTTVTFYSAYMHLSQLAPGIVPGKKVARKEVIGQGGQIYGHRRQIHFEICCDDANLQKLIGRKIVNDYSTPCFPGPWRAVDQVPPEDGRSDSVFGQIHIYLPPETPVRSNPPSSHRRSGDGKRLEQELWLSIAYQQGRSILTTRDKYGQVIASREEKEPEQFEYKLYKTASERHASLTDASDSSPSGWYELLRFGRNLGRDPLPADAPHWRKIATADGELWADLNGPGTRKFSDADCLPVMGWNCYDDDPSPDDQRCNSLKMKVLVRDPADPESLLDRVKLAARLGKPEVRAKLRRTICKTPCEWDRATIAKRYGWVREQMDKPEDWGRFERHLLATTFDDLPQEYLDAQWHFHPHEFIAHFRQCGWLSLSEMIGLLPAGFKSYRHMAEILVLGQRAKLQILPSHIGVGLNNMLRKYGLNTPLRTAHFFGQAVLETDYLQTVVEYADGWAYDKRDDPDKAVELGNEDIGDGPKYKGRGLIQTTGKTNYAKYGKHRGIDMTIGDNNLLFEHDAYTACDSAGLYWVSLRTRDRNPVPNVKPKWILDGRLNISQRADKSQFQGLTDAAGIKASVSRVTRQINSAEKHLPERCKFFTHAYSALSDLTEGMTRNMKKEEK
ncbi:glycoside hydrolase family 19 protein [Paraherbaspirillum soli]|uniref:Glycoside hydrolase family 19 protein n=1 Tax=Paraherbaspirillum soli TaxID=631222 RepID=A0ABW0MCG2_9BURK